MSEGLNKLTGAIGDTIKTAPKIYEDGLQPTVQEIGKFVARFPRAINAAFMGIDKWVLNKEYNIEETKKILEQKLQNIDPNKIVEPEAYVAIPAVQALSYSMSNGELRELYANLLAKSMNIDTKKSVHPSLVEIIKQMSPIDAKIFKIICESKHTPLIDLSVKKVVNEGCFSVKNISWITIYDHTSVSLSIDNLVRLRLIEIQDSSSYLDKSIYDVVKNTKFYTEMMKQLHLLNSEGIKEKYKFIQQTYLASSFYNICIRE